MLILLSLLASASMSVVPEEVDAGILLHEPATGATLTLPEDWTFATGEEGLMAFSADERSFVLLRAAEKNFEQVREDVRPLILSRLDDVVVATTSIEGLNERGALEGIVKAHGVGTSKLDGEPVEFAALTLKSGEQGVLVLGAWKDAISAERVKLVLSSLHVKDSIGEAGLEITNARTGAKVKLPKGWEVVRSRKGLIAANPDGNAMAILVGWQGDFEKELARIQKVLVGWVFKEVKFGEFGIIEASHGEHMGRVVSSNGTAVDRSDDRPVDFVALRVQVPEKNEGAVLFGAWKDAEHAAQVKQLLASLRLPKLEVEKAEGEAHRDHERSDSK